MAANSCVWRLDKDPGVHGLNSKDFTGGDVETDSALHRTLVETRPNIIMLQGAIGHCGVPQITIVITDIETLHSTTIYTTNIYIYTHIYT